MISNSEVSLCVDTLLVETVLADPKLYKKAGLITDLMEKVKAYFSAHIDPEHPVASVLKVLAPGALWLFMRSVGLGGWGMLLGWLIDVFHIDVPGMLGTAFEKVKEMISGGSKVSSAQVDSATQAIAQDHAQPSSPQEAQEAYQKMQEKQQEAPADDHVYSSLELLHDAKLIRLALIDYEQQSMRLMKEGARPSMMSFLGGYSSTKAKGSSLLGKIIGWIIKIALVSAGLMVAGDVANSLLGRPSALSGTYQEGKDNKPTETESAPAAPRSTQTKFPFKGDAPLSISWPMVNNPANVEAMIIQFAKDTYSGLDGKEGLMRNSPAFQNVKDDIEWFNIHNPGTTAIFIPHRYPSKKALVDYFIDDVAKAAQ
jgi:hypothetical protein